MNGEGIWLDGVHIGLQEREVEKENFLSQGVGPYSHSFVLQDKNGKPNQVKEEWQYQYDVLGRRTSKVQLENGKILADSQVEFIWDGSHLVQEIDHKNNRTFSYIYSHPSSYEPLAQLEFAKDNEKPTGCYYYHNDQIGIYEVE